MQPIDAVRTYPVQCVNQKNGSQRIRVIMSPGAKKMGRAIYMFHSTNHEKRLVGATTSLRGRIYKYHTDINGKKRKNPFLEDIRSAPGDFRLSVLEVLSPGKDLQEREKFHIKRMKSFKRGYNQNRGGGGSFAHSRVTKTAAEVLRKPVFDTPIKRYRFRRTEKGVRVDFGSSPTKVKRRLIYSILEEKEGSASKENQGENTPAGRTKHQIGLTTQQIRRRIGQHVHIINNPNHPETNRDLYAQIRQNPESFAVAVMHEAEEGEDLADLERTFIKSKPLTFNQNKGGGGLPGGVKPH